LVLVAFVLKSSGIAAREPFPNVRQRRLNLSVADPCVLETSSDRITELLEAFVFGKQHQTISNPQRRQRGSRFQLQRVAVLLGNVIVPRSPSLVVERYSMSLFGICLLHLRLNLNFRLDQHSIRPTGPTC
jgi:hypothetical protein